MEAATSLVLLSYDVPTTNRSAASRVAHLIFGRNDASREGPVPYVCRAGVVWIGQSVFLMPRAVAEELAERLHGLGATVATAHVAILPADIEALRRRRRSRGGLVNMLTESVPPRIPAGWPHRRISSPS